MSALSEMRAEVYAACAAQAGQTQHPHSHIKEAITPRKWGRLAKDIVSSRSAFMKANPSSAEQQVYKAIQDSEIASLGMLPEKGSSSMGKQVAVATLASLPMLGIAMGIPAGQSFLERRRARDNYRRMLERNPELAQKDPDKVRESYEVLESFAPSMTKNPHVAGSFVAKNLEYEAVDPAEVKNLIDIEKGVGDTASQRLSEQFMRAGVSTLSVGPIEAVKAT